MAKRKRTGLILGIGAVIAVLGYLLFGKKAEAVPNNIVTVSLENPPSGTERWQLTLYDWNKARIESKFDMTITDSAVFQIPPGTVFPLRVDMLVYRNGTVDYRMQSVGTEFPFPAEWYAEVFIPDYGSHYL